MHTTAAVSSSNDAIKESAPATQQLDTRGMEAPQPILAILKKAGELTGNGVLEVRLDNQPMQLYDLLQQRGYCLVGEKQADGSFVGRIRARSGAGGH